MQEDTQLRHFAQYGGDNEVWRKEFQTLRPGWLGWQSRPCVRAKSLQSCLFVTPWTVVLQVSLSMGFFRQEYWREMPFPPPGELPDPGIELKSLVSLALAGGFFISSTTWEAQIQTLPLDKWAHWPNYWSPPQFPHVQKAENSIWFGLPWWFRW